MNCILQAGIQDCPNSVPGVQAAWLGRFDDALTYLYAAGGLSQIVQILTISASNLGLYPYYVEAGVARGQEQLSNGTYAQGVDLFIPSLETVERETLEGVINDRLLCILQDRNGIYWLYGQEFGLRVTEYTGETGTTRGANGYTLRLEGQDRFLVREVSPSVVEDGQVQNGGTQAVVSGPPPVINVGGNLPGGAVSSNLSTWFNPAGNPLALEVFGNYPISNFY